MIVPPSLMKVAEPDGVAFSTLGEGTSLAESRLAWKVSRPPPFCAPAQATADSAIAATKNRRMVPPKTDGKDFSGPPTSQMIRSCGVEPAELVVTPRSTLEPMPERPTLFDFFRLRFSYRGALPFAPAGHMIQSAARASRMGAPEETVLACLLHDVGLALLAPDHGYW